MKHIRLERLSQQLLSDHKYHTPDQVVAHMLCMQSQDRNQHLRAIASRAWCTKDDILQAYNKGQIVRTWTQRGTIHVVNAKDVQWMTKLCATKTLSSFTKRKEYLDINDHQYDLALWYLQEYLSSWPKLRKDIGLYLEQSWISIQSGLLYNILCYAGSSGLIVQWPIIDEKQAFVLTSQRIKNTTILSDTDAVRELCLRYFTSHGPATIEDLQRWSGLGKTLLKQWIIDCGEELQHYEDDWIIYYSSPTKNLDISLPTAHFLAGFDERLLGYKNRSATVDHSHLNKIDVARNGIFKPTVMVDGNTIGIWWVQHKAKISEVTITPFAPFTSETILLLEQEIQYYAKYLAKPVSLIIL